MFVEANALLLTLIVIILTFLYLADSKLISYSTQSSLISDHFSILFDLNLPVIQINRASRSFRKISSIDNQFVLTLYSINLTTVYLLICLHILIILIWHYLIRLIFVYPPLLLSTEHILSFPGLILSLLTRGNYFVDYNVNIHPLNLNLILFSLKFSIALQEKTSPYQFVILY